MAGTSGAVSRTIQVNRGTGAVDAELSGVISQTAGTFVCNHVFYGLMHHLPAAVPGGFMHLPLLPAQAARMPGHASLPLHTQLEGVRLAALAAWTRRAAPDVRESGGAIA